MYVVIDADGLYLVQNEPEVVRGNAKAVLTPNVVEFKRLCESLVRTALLSLRFALNSDHKCPVES